MTDEEWLSKYEKLVKSGYCDDCNELNCLGGNAPYRLLEIIKKYQKALDKACNDWEEEVKDCNYLMIKNHICNQKCGLCNKEKRVKLLKEWCMKDEED